MNFGIKVDKQAGSGAYKLTLVSESITPWENDLVSHDATAKEYIVINSTPGGLKNAITAANKDYSKIKNLKITGEINAQDFYFMRDSMDLLSALNLKEVMIKKSIGYLDGGSGGDIEYDDCQIPCQAMYAKKSLNLLVLPDNLTKIGIAAFGECQNLTGSLNIPEGVTEIEVGAFVNCRAMTDQACQDSGWQHRPTRMDELQQRPHHSQQHPQGALRTGAKEQGFLREELSVTAQHHRQERQHHQGELQKGPRPGTQVCDLSPYPHLLCP